MATTIHRACEADAPIIARIGRAGVEASHRESCSAEDMSSFLAANYNDEAIREELNNAGNIYHLICQDMQPAGFSKIVLDAAHPNVPDAHATKLDRIYLLQAFYDRRLGLELLNFNIRLSKQQGQSAMWLFTWTGNERAVRFYKKAGFEIIGSHRFKVTEAHYNAHHQMRLEYEAGSG